MIMIEVGRQALPLFFILTGKKDIVDAHKKTEAFDEPPFLFLHCKRHCATLSTLPGVRRRCLDHPFWACCRAGCGRCVFRRSGC